MARRQVILNQRNSFYDEPEVIYVSKKHNVIYERYGDGKGVNLSHAISVDLKNYELKDENILYKIYNLKKN